MSSLTEAPEEVTQIMDDLQRRFANEQSTNATVHAEGRLSTHYQGTEKVYWLHRHIPRNSVDIKDITGSAIGTVIGQQSLYNPDNSAISRNSPNGNMLAEVQPGMETPNGIFLIDRALFTHEPADLQDIDITTLTASYPRIASLIRHQHELAEALRERKRLLAAKEQAQRQADETGLDELQTKLDDTEERIRRIQQRIETFIARARLRSRPLLDPEQNKAKRLNLLAGPAIIDGGPGTGKTTTLIHRIQYLLDPKNLRLDEQCTLDWNAEDDTLLARTEQRQPFRFYSPNDTLQYYLKEALQTEGLPVNPNTVITWAKHRQNLLRDFNLTGTNGRFILPRAYTPLLHLNGESVQQLQQELEEHLLFDLHTLVDRLQRNVEIGTFNWQHDPAVQQIRQQIAALNAHASVDDILSPLQQLRDNGAELLKTYREAYNQARDTAVLQLLSSVRQDATLFKQVLQLAESTSDTVEDADEQQEIEAFEEEEKPLSVSQIDERHLLLVRGLLRSFVRAYSLSKSLPDHLLKDKNAQLATLLESRLLRVSYEAIATNGRFIQLFAPLLRGPEVLLLQALPRRAFTSFRREVLYGKRFTHAFDGGVAPKWSPEKATAIHADEADVLLLGLYQLARKFYTHLPRVFANSTHPYLQRYRDEMRPVVGVDEASDFTPLQLAVITMLSHPRYTCVTLCGDLMQRLERQGLMSWDDYTFLFPATRRASLSISYRQCSALLRLAARLYEGQMHEKPAYRVSRRIRMPFRLRPTYCRNNDEEARFDWLVKLLKGLANALGVRHLPNLAILTKDVATADHLAQQLSENESLYRANLQTESCRGQRIGESNTIRVFPVTEIKGMEFDGIIFWDADQLETENHTLDLDRLMYVAISRASFYVAVTFSRFFPKALSQVKNYFTDQTWAEQMLEDVAEDEEDV